MCWLLHLFRDLLLTLMQGQWEVHKVVQVASNFTVSSKKNHVIPALWTAKSRNLSTSPGPGHTKIRKSIESIQSSVCIYIYIIYISCVYIYISILYRNMMKYDTFNLHVIFSGEGEVSRRCTNHPTSQLNGAQNLNVPRPGWRSSHGKWCFQ